MRFPLVEERMPDALPPIVGEEDRLTAVEDRLWVVAVALEERDELVRVAGEWGGRRGADDRVAVSRGHDDAVGVIGERGEIAGLVRGVTVIEIGPFAENGEPQPAELRNDRAESRP